MFSPFTSLRGNNIETQSVRLESFRGNVAPYIIQTLHLPTKASSRFMSLKLLASPSKFSVGSYSSPRQPERGRGNNLSSATMFNSHSCVCVCVSISKRKIQTKHESTHDMIRWWVRRQKKKPHTYCPERSSFTLGVCADVNVLLLGTVLITWSARPHSDI